ncbi:flavodoxin family protein [Maledivibacter halophilus]|uniref:Multimeric flavodoxin WrbA n=1 Tax=Maledivibacter halophilus TaxID=36842 RepID=A0A1T5LTR5_9FIRM|nr:flavodoxin family protein [Maledivibacter halophilus]SKC79382.1 Multimeric flavodoxin WrbA [Maledivibacter halophilus]
MKVLALLGSPRAGKNTDTLLDEVLRGIKKCDSEINKYQLSKLEIKQCIGCYRCGNTGECIYDDDMKKLYSEFNKADVIILASPLYFNSVSSISKLMIDRCHALWASKFICKKPIIDINKSRKGIFISTAGAKQGKDGFIGAIKVVELFFKAANTEFTEELLIDNTDKISMVNEREILKRAYNIGQKLCE